MDALLWAALATAPSTATYEVARSMLCDGTSYLSRTPGSAGNRKTWTWSGWVKRGELGSGQTLFSAYSANADDGFIALGFTTADTFQINGYSTVWRVTTQVFRDPSAHYHILVAFDTTDATADSRIRLYVNGVEVTAFATPQNPSLNFDTAINVTGDVHVIGREDSVPSQYISGFLANIHFIDGLALDADDFGEINATTGQWIPKVYTGSYGTNGFHLLFDNDATTTTLGEDSSGNGNDWTLNGFTTDDSVTDTPTNNFCTLNPLSSRVGTLSGGNLKTTATTANYQSKAGSIAVSAGKWYWEAYLSSGGNYTQIGVSPESAFFNASAVAPRDFADAHQYQNNATYHSNSANQGSYGATYTTGDVIGVALDLDTGDIEMFKNGVSQGVMATGLTGTYVPSVGVYTSGRSVELNFGQKPFAHTPPTGFKALSTKNLPDPLESTPLTGSFTGNANADGWFVYLGYPPDQAGTCTINGNAITWGTHADATANGFKLRTSSASYNAAGSNTYSIAVDEDAPFMAPANAQSN